MSICAGTNHYNSDFRGDPDLDINLEMEAFITFDKNLNGQLDPEEIHEWLIPSEYDPAEAEFDHLLLWVVIFYPQNTVRDQNK